MSRYYKCDKCDCDKYEQDEFRATGGRFAKLFDIQNKKFTTITCRNCGFTELYKRDTSTGGNVLDFFT